MAKRKRSRSGGWRRGEFLAGIVLGLALALWVFPMVGRWWSQPPSGVGDNGPSASTRFEFYEIFERGEEVVEETLAPPPLSAAEPPPETVTEPQGESGTQGEPGTQAASSSPAGTSSSAVAEVPAETPPAGGAPAPAAVQTPGWYVLQIGSFTRLDAAESLKARLALVGMNARIQPVRINRETWYRVRIGPTDDLEQLNADRARLQEHRFGYYLVKPVE